MLERKKKRAFVDTKLCVACGCCEKACPLSAIRIYKGVYADVDLSKCVGCGKCVKSCPASVISVKEETS